MAGEKIQVSELKATQESLEAKSCQVLASIMELQDAGAAPEETERLRLKLLLINQELDQDKAKIYESTRRKPMVFGTEAKVAAINGVLSKSVDRGLKKVVMARDESRVKVQVLEARAASFEKQKTQLAADIVDLKQKISQILGEGGDPSDINRQVRAKLQETEDLQGWIAQLQKDAIPEAKKSLSEAQVEVWKNLINVVDEVKIQFAGELNDHLAKASEILASWQVAVKGLFDQYQTGRPPTGNSLDMVIDSKRSAFFGGIQ